MCFLQHGMPLASAIRFFSLLFGNVLEVRLGYEVFNTWSFFVNLYTCINFLLIVYEHICDQSGRSFSVKAPAS